ncbi:MAG TPA: hypothetical protein VFQ44_01890 [Streptosporangiaceae bacterium]|nr:hypothetical protein [Streptosporangiaceae bacterium]
MGELREQLDSLQATAASTPQTVLTTRHPSTQQVMKYFTFGHLPNHLAEVSAEFHALAHRLLELLPDGPELTVALRKLLESKDAAVRTAVDHHES